MANGRAPERLERDRRHTKDMENEGQMMSVVHRTRSTGRRVLASTFLIVMSLTGILAPGQVAPASAADGLGVVKTLGTALDHPFDMALGPDGNMWFSDPGKRMGRISPLGSVTTFPDPRIGNNIAWGSDGNLWFVGRATGGAFAIGRMTPAGVVTTFTDPALDTPFDITLGPDGNAWFANANRSSIGRITPAGVMTFFTAPGLNLPVAITSGADGNVWFFDADGAIGRVTMTGTITMFPRTGHGITVGMVQGPDRRASTGSPTRPSPTPSRSASDPRAAQPSATPPERRT
jgi:streptogramin lyase